jgi:hypothetical protein
MPETDQEMMPVIDSEVEAMRKRITEMEQEAQKFKEMQHEVNKDTVVIGSSR